MKKKAELQTIIALFLTASILIIVLLIYPTLREIKNVSQEMILNKENLMLVNAEDKEVKNFKTNYNIYQDNLKKLDQLFVDPQNPVGFIEFLEKEAALSNIVAQINLNSPVGQENSVKESVSEFQIYATGRFSNVLKFAEKMETGSYLIKVNKLTIQKTEQPKGAKSAVPNLVQADFVIETINNEDTFK